MDKDGNVINLPKEISIGDHVWMGCRCTILKGCSIASWNVVASGSILTHVFPEEHTLVGGSSSNQRILRREITWEK